MPITEQLVIPDRYRGKRLDQTLAEIYPDYSRARFQAWIKSGCVRINNHEANQRQILKGGEEVSIRVENGPAETVHPGQAIPLDIIYSDEHILVLNKPAGLVVHPGAGNPENTLLNALLYHDPALQNLPRAGIVQRLDKDTSGIMVVARSLKAHTSLVRQLQERSLKREYRCLVHGVMTAGGSIDAPIGRHPVKRKRMSVINSGKSAVTHYRVVERFKANTDVLVRLESGRTHQIRVHMAYIRHPVVGDPVYGGRPRFPRNALPELLDTLKEFTRQALHASRIRLAHPDTGRILEWTAPLPADMQSLLNHMREDDRHDP